MDYVYFYGSSVRMGHKVYIIPILLRGGPSLLFVPHVIWLCTGQTTPSKAATGPRRVLARALLSIFFDSKFITSDQSHCYRVFGNERHC